VKMSPELLEIDRNVSDRWYVSNGAAAVGPVNLDLLERGVQAGKVPLESFVRHEGWNVWRPLHEVVISESDLADHPTLPNDDVVLAGRPSRPEDFTPADALAGAADRHDALLLLLAAVVSQFQADGAIIHEVREKGAVAVCAHGPNMFDVLGTKTKILDPAVVAAMSGSLVVAEPIPGPAGEAVAERMIRLGVLGEGLVMVPIRPNAKLFGLLEVGRKHPFRAKELAGIEALVEALIATLENDHGVPTEAPKSRRDRSFRSFPDSARLPKPDWF
jgi:hypothetical protein